MLKNDETIEIILDKARINMYRKSEIYDTLKNQKHENKIGKI